MLTGTWKTIKSISVLIIGTVSETGFIELNKKNQILTLELSLEEEQRVCDN